REALWPHSTAQPSTGETHLRGGGASLQAPYPSRKHRLRGSLRGTSGSTTRSRYPVEAGAWGVGGGSLPHGRILSTRPTRRCVVRYGKHLVAASALDRGG